MAIEFPVRMDQPSGDGTKFMVDATQELILSTYDADDDEMKLIVDSVNGRHAASLFFKELLDSVETLSGIADEHGARTLSDLMYLHAAIMNDSFIDFYPGESSVLEIAKALSSGERWSAFIKVEHMTQEYMPATSA